MPTARGTPDDNDVALLCRVIFLNRDVAVLMLEDIIVRIDEGAIEEMIPRRGTVRRENTFYGSTEKLAAAVGAAEQI